MAEPITHREFKLLLKPEHFATRKSLHDFNDLLAKTADKMGVKYEPFDPIESMSRVVQFYDTADQTLRKNKLIFRIRQLRDGGWPDESWELTFKSRTPDREQAEGFDNNSSFPKQQKLKFKEELIPKGAVGTIESIYSNNCILESPDVNLSMPLSHLADQFPHIKSMDVDLDETLSIVNNAKVFEIEAKLGNLMFGHHIAAPASIAVWARPIPDDFQPLIAEFGWSYHPVDDDKGREADKVADQFFKDVQLPLASWIADGTTKTALIYGDKGA